MTFKPTGSRGSRISWMGDVQMKDLILLPDYVGDAEPAQPGLTKNTIDVV